ncbi:MAG TPA: DUF1302 domain-containing protein [Usitatibacter sp.]|nr:DUF1302 domain-containing protein [Usitatibacter sp.]
MSPAFRLAAKPLVLALVVLAAAPAHALQFSWDNGLDLSLDTTITYGVAVRTENPDPSLIGIANGGTSRSTNEDNGDLNFKKNRPFANLAKATSELELKYRNFGFFGRGTAFYDFDLHDSDKLGPTGRDRLGRGVVGLDGFVSGAFEPAGHRTNVRVGRQVISWGESTFIPNGINVINPVDLSLLRSPGAELKEAFIPTAGIWASTELTRSASIEGFYLSNFDKIRIDPKGSFFSNNDTVSDDSDRVIVSFGRRRDDRSPLTNPVPPGIPVISATAQALYGPFDPAASIWVPRAPDRNPSDWGQYGVALRYFASALNDTEFGLYFMNYHSRIPFVSGTKGTTTSVLTGGPLIQPICGVPALVALCATGTARYFAEFPENIRLFGASFSTSAPYGIALQGEYSYRPNQPLQLSAPEVILAALGLPNLITGFTQIPGAPAGATAAALVPDGSYIQGWQRVKMSQLQVTGTKSWPNVARADNLVVVGEVGATYFHNLPSDQKFAAPAVYLPATTFGSIVSQAFSVQTEGFVTNFSWGYRLLGRLEYSNLLFGGNVAPRIAFAHDVKGVGPTFNEDTKSVSVGASWEYQRKWLVDAQYTTYFGGRTFCGTDQPPPGSAVTPGQPASFCSSANPLKDRDFYSVSVSYSF